MDEVTLPSIEQAATTTSGGGGLDGMQKSSRDTTSTGEGVGEPTAKQDIIEVPNGQAIDGQPQRPGPQYKRGRGRSFFKEAPRKGVSCQGRFNLSGLGRNKPKSSCSFQNYAIYFPPMIFSAVPGCDRSLHKLRDYYKVRFILRLFSAHLNTNVFLHLRFELIGVSGFPCSCAEIQGELLRMAHMSTLDDAYHVPGGCVLACLSLLKAHCWYGDLFNLFPLFSLQICPYHLELNCMVVEGQSIRFCQQCGRFQLLDEFDGDRRSCRRKLEKHNERRRKLEGSATDSDSGGEGSGRSRSGLKYHRSGGSPPRPWSVPPLPVGAGGSGLDVNQMLQNIAYDDFLMNGLGSSLAGGMHSLASSGWMPSSMPGGGGAVASNSDGVSGGGGSAPHMHPHMAAVLAEVAAANTSTQRNQIQQQHQQQRQRIPVLTSEPAHPTAASPSAGLTADALQQFLKDGDAGGRGTRGMSNDNANTNAGIDTAIGMGGGGGVPTIKSEPSPLGAVGSAFACPPSTRYTDGHSSRNRGDNTRVAALAAAAAAASADEQQRRDNGSHQQQQQQQAQQQSARDAKIGEMLRSLQSQISNGSNGGSQPSVAFQNNNTNNGMPMHGNDPSVAPGGSFHPNAPNYALSGALGGNSQAPVVGQLLSLLQQLQNANGPRGLPEQDVMTLSLKLFKMTPAQLPSGLLHELTAWMTKTPTYSEIAMRPGCIHLTTSTLSTESERTLLDSSICNTVHRVLRNTGLGVCGSTADEALLLQMQSADGPKAAIVRDGELKMVLDLATTDSTHRPPVPSLFLVRPLAATPDYNGCFLLLGQGMDSNENDQIFCRNQCQNAQVEVINRGPALLDENNSDASGTGGGWVQVAVPHLNAGGYAMEIARGPFVSSPIGFVVLEDPLAVAEVRQLETDPDGVSDVIAFIQKLGVVVQMRKRVDNDVSLSMEMHDETVDRIAQVAQEVAAVSLKKGWPAVLRLVLPVIAAATPAAQGLESVSRLLGTGVTPLSAAVVSGDAALVEVLAAWAAVHGIGLFNAEKSAASWGLSALHLAAMLNNPCPIATMLNKWVNGAIPAWSVVQPAAGVSPLSIAASLGQVDLLQMLVLQGVPCAAEALSAIYKLRNLMANSSSEELFQQKISKVAEQQGKLFERDQGSTDNTNERHSPPFITEPPPWYSFCGDEEGASSSNSTSVRSSKLSSPHRLEDLSRQPSVVLGMALNEVMNDSDQAGLDATIRAASITARNISDRQTRRRIIAADSYFSVAAAAIAPAFTTAAAKRSLLFFMYHLVLTVLLPALLPERIALGAAVLPAVVVASFTSYDHGFLEMLRSSFCAALMTLLAISLNRSSAMAQVRASAFNMLCSSPRVRVVLSTLWLLALTSTLGLSSLQNVALFLTNSILCLVPLPAVSSGKEAWLRMTGAASIALSLAVCVPIIMRKLLERRAAGEGNGSSAVTAVEQDRQQRRHWP